jgi:hypothetical protein
MNQYPALEQLLGGHLHEDWADDYADVWQAIDAFVARQPSYAPAAPGEIAQLLDECGSDGVLEQRLEDLGLVYYPPGLGWKSYRTWLLAVSDRLEEALRKSPAA